MMTTPDKQLDLINSGIDAMAFYTSEYALPLSALAQSRGVDPDKYTIGLGVNQMSVSPPDEDIVTLAANAGSKVLKQYDQDKIDSIDMLLFATESGVDQSKAAGIYVHKCLNLPRHCRTIELKQACYAGTAAIQLANQYVLTHPDKSVLIIMSDIARYGLNTSGESSQGGGAVAFLISQNPRILKFSKHAGVVCEDVMDFWRPNYRDEALVDGKFSIEVYLKTLKESFDHYSKQSKLDFNAHAAFLFHIPIPRLAEKAYQKLKIHCAQKDAPESYKTYLQNSLIYSRAIGNCYTASLYLGLISFLEQTDEDLSNQRIGLYSYGSGCVGEFFSGVIQSDYKKYLNQNNHQSQLSKRILLDVQTYEQYYNFKYPEDGSTVKLPKHHTGEFRLDEIRQHQRIYKAVKS